MGKPDVIYKVVSDDVIYRIEPSADGPPGSGFTCGADFSWRNRDGEKWSEPMFLTPDALEALSAALTEAAKSISAK